MEAGVVDTAKNGRFSVSSIKSVTSGNAEQVNKSEDSSEEEVSLGKPLYEEDSLQELQAREYDRDRRHFKTVFIFINVLAVVQGGVIVYILSQWLNGFKWYPDEAQLSDFNVHLVCNVLGTIILTAYGILIFRAFPQHPVKRLAIIHTVIMIIVVLLTAFGIKVAYDSHYLFSRTHLYSLHSWMGVTIFGLLFFELVTGNWLFFNDIVHASLKYLHTIVGIMLFIFSLASCVSGILTAGNKALADNQRVRRPGSPGPLVQNFTLNSFGLLATVFSILVRYLYMGYRFRRRPRPGSRDQDITENEILLAIVRNSTGSPEEETGSLKVEMQRSAGTTGDKTRSGNFYPN